MPRKRNPWRTIADQSSLTLSLLAGFTINLVTDGFKEFFLSNPVILVCLLIVLAFIGYQIIKMRSTLLTTTFVVLVISVLFNLFVPWFEDTFLHKEFTTINFTIFICITIIFLILSGYIATHPVARGKRKLKNKFISNAMNNNRAYFASIGIVDQRRRSSPQKKKKASKKLPKPK